MREALFSQDGWGCQHVNQDTNWEVPSSPEPANKDPSGGPLMWKPNINNGTDLWESNLRNGGQPPAQQVPKPSWGHTPSSNLGGTWGEDDDGADSTSVWTGQSSNSTTSGVAVGANAPGVGAAAGPQWGQAVGVGVGVGVALNSTGNNNAPATGALPAVAPGCGNSGNNLAVSGTVGGAGGSVGGSTGNGWGDPREMRPLAGAGPMDIRNVDPRDPITMRGVGAPTGDPRDLRMIDPRDPIRGDPRGISGRLNGTSEMWGHHPQIAHNQIQNINKMVGPVVSATGSNIASSNIGPSGVGSVSGNVGAQWGATQAVVGGPKDISKQITGWEEPSPPPQRRNIPNYDDGTSLWGQQSRLPGSGAHWKDMTDSMSRSHLMRAQNPTGNIVGSGIVGNSNVPVGGNPNNSMGGGGGVGPQSRLANTPGPGGVVGGQHGKPDAGAMWVHPNNSGGGVGGGRNAQVSSWGDDSHNVGVVGGAAVSGNNWVDDKQSTSLAQIGANANSWSDSPSGGGGGGGVGGGWGGNKQSKLPAAGGASSGWSNANTVGGNVEGGDLSSDWPHGGIVGKSQQQQQQQKIAGINVGVGILNTDMVKQSKQYRLLVENGFKKEDVERALLSTNMNIEEAAEMLRANPNSSLAMEGWRRHEEVLGSYADHSNTTNTGGFPQRYPVGSAQPSMSFPPNNLMTNMSGTPGNNPNMAVLQVQKYLNQGGPHNVAIGGPQSLNANASVAFCQNAASAAPAVNIASNANNQPSGQHIRQLGQQIQLAIHSGFISSQILTQPLTQNTLNLLNQLLSSIKHLQAAQQSLSRGSNANPMVVNVTIAKYKQQIQNLQNQINAQQAVYIKQQNLQQNSQQQQQQQQHPSGHINNSGNDYLRNHDAITTLQGNFSELNLNKPSGYQGAPNQQSRLNQWKLPVLEKDTIATDSTDFSRAPGATKQNLTTNSSNMGPLGLQNDGTWSTGRNIGDGWPDPSIDNENKDWSVAPTAAAYTDLVQEFEPGKPWKGSQIKSIEDDPSITPGSVARSPLSINPTPKDADIFANTGKNSPTDLPPLSLSSSTWSFNPNQNFPSWSDNSQQCATSELWTSPLNKSSSRGPPPGLSTNKSGGVTATTPSPTVAGNSNGWLPNRSVPNTNTTWTGANAAWNSSWLLLKNLNAQIDGSTLRTLCMQHGPLVSFHPYLNQGIALCKYTTREEANKAQMALNNCVLGNTTIFAESPSENEVQNILQHLPQAPSSTNSAGSVGNGSGVGNISASVSNSSSGAATISGGNSNSNGNGAGGNGGSTAVGTSGAASNASGGGGSGNSVGSGSVGSSSTGSNNNGSGSNMNTAVNGAPPSGNGGNNTKNPTAGGGQPNVANVTPAAGGNSTWRQSTQNQALQQGPSRPAGREADYDYISQFVCSIVDD